MTDGISPSHILNRHTSPLKNEKFPSFDSTESLIGKLNSSILSPESPQEIGNERRTHANTHQLADHILYLSPMKYDKQDFQIPDCLLPEPILENSHNDLISNHKCSSCLLLNKGPTISNGIISSDTQRVVMEGVWMDLQMLVKATKGLKDKNALIEFVERLLLNGEEFLFSFLESVGYYVGQWEEEKKKNQMLSLQNHQLRLCNEKNIAMKGYWGEKWGEMGRELEKLFPGMECKGVVEIAKVVEAIEEERIAQGDEIEWLRKDLESVRKEVERVREEGEEVVEKEKERVRVVERELKREGERREERERELEEREREKKRVEEDYLRVLEERKKIQEVQEEKEKEFKKKEESYFEWREQMKISLQDLENSNRQLREEIEELRIQALEREREEKERIEREREEREERDRRKSDVVIARFSVSINDSSEENETAPLKVNDLYGLPDSSTAAFSHESREMHSSLLSPPLSLPSSNLHSSNESLFSHSEIKSQREEWKEVGEMLQELKRQLPLVRRELLEAIPVLPFEELVRELERERGEERREREEAERERERDKREREGERRRYEIQREKHGKKREEWREEKGLYEARIATLTEELQKNKIHYQESLMEIKASIRQSIERRQSKRTILRSSGNSPLSRAGRELQEESRGEERRGEARRETDRMEKKEEEIRRSRIVGETGSSSSEIFDVTSDSEFYLHLKNLRKKMLNDIQNGVVTGEMPLDGSFENIKKVIQQRVNNEKERFEKIQTPQKIYNPQKSLSRTPSAENYRKLRRSQHDMEMIRSNIAYIKQQLL